MLVYDVAVTQGIWPSPLLKQFRSTTPNLLAILS